MTTARSTLFPGGTHWRARIFRVTTDPSGGHPLHRCARRWADAL